MGLLEMFIGGMVKGYMDAKEEQKRQNEKLEREIDESFDNLERLLSSQESKPSYLDEFVEDMKSDIESLCSLANIEFCSQHFSAMFLPLFDVYPTGDQIIFIDKMLEKCPSSLIIKNSNSNDSPYSIISLKSYNNCFKNNNLISEIDDKCIPNNDSYIWCEIFENMKDYELDRV